MKASEMRDKSRDELKAFLDESRTELFKLKLRHFRGQSEKSSDLNKLRKDIARANTILRERDLEG